MENKKERIFKNTYQLVKSKKILSMIKVTDKHVHDSKPLPRMVDNIIKLYNVTVAIGKLFCDGAI